jgi:transketolase
VNHDIEQLSINTIRTLAMDAVQNAGSGHPGTAVALAPVAYVLWKKFLRFNPHNPGWFDRDRFVLSAGHASILQYAMLHLTGYDLSLEEIRNFRQWGSRTPGHPEYAHVPGVETTTGPLGQGIMTAVGMAIAEAFLAARYNRDGLRVIDHYTWVLCGDGDLMEGASHEAASLAGHLGLGKLVCIYDDNRITIEGSTDLSCSDDVAKRFEACGWHVENIGDRANDTEAIAVAIQRARDHTDRPSLVVVRSHIAWGAPNLQDTSDAHGAPLGEEEIRLAKENYGWPADKTFYVPAEVREHMGEAVAAGARMEQQWRGDLETYRDRFPEPAAELEEAISGSLPAAWDGDLPEFDPADGPVATRAASGKILNAVAGRVPWLVGGSADLAPSNKSFVGGSSYMSRTDLSQRNIAWGIREHVMAAASTGMALHGGIRPYAATFFVFTDYMRPSIRLAALMGVPVIYIMTHDSIAVGGDGPTHQPVEHLASLRAMPGICLIRPADANETAEAWRIALGRSEGPTMLVLTRQKIPVLNRTGADLAPASGLAKGAYILARETGDTPDAILIASGSEVALAVEARERLAAGGVDTRVVSMPSWELFEEQDSAYRDEVLPPSVTARLSIEAGASLGWRKWVGDRGDVIAVDRFGASADAGDIFREFGLTTDDVVSKTKRIARRS